MFREVLHGDDGTVLKRYWVPPGRLWFPRPWIREHRALERLSAEGGARSRGYSEEPLDGGTRYSLVKDFIEGVPFTTVTADDARAMASRLAAIHAQGVITDDASRGNFVRDERGDVHCIDYGRARVSETRGLPFHYQVGRELAKFRREGAHHDPALWAAFREQYFSSAQVNGLARRALDLGFAVFRGARWWRRESPFSVLFCRRRAPAPRAPAESNAEGPDDPHHVLQIHTNRSWGGGETQVLGLTAGLHERGVRVTLMVAEEGELKRRADQRGLPTVPLPASSSAAVQAVRELGVDIVHVHDSDSASIGVRAGRAAGVPVVLSRRIASPVRQNPWSRAKYSARNLAAVIAISETVRDVFMRTARYPPHRIHVVPSAIDMDALAALPHDDAFRSRFGRGQVVGGIGRLSVKKNWQMLIRVAAQMKPGHPELQWVLVGEGPEKERLVSLAREVGVEDRVHFLGFREDAARLLQDFSVLFFPSLMEGASVTVREAMALGVPVVAVDAPGTMESLGGHGIGIAPDDMERAATEMARLIDDSDARDALAGEARESARRRFSITGLVNGTLAVYRTVLSR